MQTSRPVRISREMRLLILTIVVSAAALLLLARFRFPDAVQPTTTAQPLERLAARASFDELGGVVARLADAVSPDLVALRLTRPATGTPVVISDLTGRAPMARGDSTYAPALRINATTAMVVMPSGAELDGLLESAGTAGTAEILGTDFVHRIARVRVPETLSRPIRTLDLAALRTQTYVVAVEGTQAGYTFRPVFIGRADRFTSSRWQRPLLPLGGVTVSPGTLFFTLAGEFLGCAVVEDGMLAIASAADVLDAVNSIVEGRVPIPDPGLAIQELTPDLAAATGAPSGVLITDVFPRSLSDGIFEPGDVLTHVANQPVGKPETVLMDLAQRLAYGLVQVRFLRQGDERSVVLRNQTMETPDAEGPTEQTLTVEAVRRVGVRVTAVRRGSNAAAAGLQPGDLITKAGTIVAPTVAQVQAAVRGEQGAWVLLLVRRGDRQHLAALRSEGSGDITAP